MKFKTLQLHTKGQNLHLITNISMLLAFFATKLKNKHGRTDLASLPVLPLLLGLEMHSYLNFYSYRIFLEGKNQTTVEIFLLTILTQ